MIDRQTFEWLATRYGSVLVKDWVERGGRIATMAIEAMRAVAESAGEPVAPEAVLVVLRYASDNPDGLVIGVGAGTVGPLTTDEKAMLVNRLLACLAEGDPCQINVQHPKPRMVIIPGGASDPDKAGGESDG